MGTIRIWNITLTPPNYLGLTCGQSLPHPPPQAFMDPLFLFIDSRFTSLSYKQASYFANDTNSFERPCDISLWFSRKFGVLRL